MLAAIAGNQVGYVVGARTGHRLVARKNGRYINTKNLHKVTGLLERHGFLAVLVARWIPWVRTLCPMVAGAAGMDHRRYTVASTLGAIIWAPVLLLIGYLRGRVPRAGAVADARRDRHADRGSDHRHRSSVSGTIARRWRGRSTITTSSRASRATPSAELQPGRADLVGRFHQHPAGQLHGQVAFRHRRGRHRTARGELARARRAAG